MNLSSVSEGLDIVEGSKLIETFVSPIPYFIVEIAGDDMEIYLISIENALNVYTQFDR